MVCSCGVSFVVGVSVCGTDQSRTLPLGGCHIGTVRSVTGMTRRDQET